MSLVRWSPWGNVATLQERINRLFEDAFPTDDPGNALALSEWRPMVDIYETNEAIVIKAELPGVKKEDLSVDIKENVLTIKGERSADKEVKEENYYRRERAYGSFQRAFTLPATINSENIKADFKDGVLKVEVPKPENEKPKQVEINIE